MISARYRVVQYDAGTPAQMRGVTVDQEDFVIADSCGTVIVPAGRIEEVLDLAERIERRQDSMVQAVRAGHRASEVMHDTQFEAIAADSSDELVTALSWNTNRISSEEREISDLFVGLDSAAVSDALDKLGIPGQVYGIMPLSNYKKTIVGPAFTVRYVPASDPPGSVGDFIDDVATGDIVVIDNDRRTDCTVWGDIMTQYAGLRGISGTVIDGVCRDVDKALTDGYPLFTAGRWTRTGKDRVQVADIGQAVSVGKFRVEHRELVIADANGVMIVPHRRAREVARVAAEIEETEGKIRELLVNGAGIAEARKKPNYHMLQRKG